MARSRQEWELSEQFSDEYIRAQTPVMLDLERAVCGCDYGGTSWTTREEAERIGELLTLGKGRKLLEIGAGSGWPALYLAGTSGCDVTLADVPLTAIRIAAERVSTEPVAGAVSLAVADGASLPFRDNWFDAISHSDVLCCLAPKREVLGECRRVIRQSGTMAFSVIYVAPGLSDADRARAVECGPPYIEAECDYAELLTKTGWDIVDQVDVSAAYEETGRRHIREVEARANGLRELLGDDEYEDMLIRRNRNLGAVADRIVRRDVISVCPAGGKQG